MVPGVATVPAVGSVPEVGALLMRTLKPAAWSARTASLSEKPFTSGTARGATATGAALGTLGSATKYEVVPSVDSRERDDRLAFGSKSAGLTFSVGSETLAPARPAEDALVAPARPSDAFATAVFSDAARSSRLSAASRAASAPTGSGSF